jgi:hypothetical protein
VEPGGVEISEYSLGPEEKRGMGYVGQHPEFGHYDEKPSLASEMKDRTPKKSWFGRWFLDRRAETRRVVRAPSPGLIAYWWTGGRNEPQHVRDISASGVYVVTEERWYPGTHIQMTLAKTLGGKSHGEDSITLYATAVRWGHDGVGLEFVLKGTRYRRRIPYWLVDGISKKQVERFISLSRSK